MKLKDLEEIEIALDNLADFAEANTDNDESGIGVEMALQYNKSIVLISREKKRIYLRNAKAKLKRNTH